MGETGTETISTALVEWLMLPHHVEDFGDLDGLLARPAWMKDGACGNYPTEWWFPDGPADTSRPTAICAACLVRDECLDYALADPSLGGIWGGTGQRERRRMRRERAA